MMRKIAAFTAALLTSRRIATATELVLSEKIIKLSKTAAELSALAYEENPPGNLFDHFGFFDAEPDQAIVAKKDGYCFAAFRGTTLTWDDWQQNLLLGSHEVCHKDPDKEKQCCNTRIGFWQAYDTSYAADMEQSLRECAKDCVIKDECVVLTGHSQGGAIAAVAAIALADLNPYVITFGQPPTIDAPCPVITSDRWYRYVNTKATERGVIGIFYDPVPFLPGFGADDWGHMMLLSQDNTGIAYIGLDAQDYFRPLDVKGFESHSMVAADDSPFPGYLDRIEAMMTAYQNGTYPVRTTGYVAGSLCTEDKECETGKCDKETSWSWKRCIGIDCKSDEECDTGRCDSGLCLPKLGSCAVCDEDSDCAHGHCSVLYRCSGEGGLVDNECLCLVDYDCASGRCEGFVPPVCEAQLGAGSRCNENSDCLSGVCSWRFRCKEGELSPDKAEKTLAIAAEEVAKGLQDRSIDVSDAVQEGAAAESKDMYSIAISVGFLAAIVLVVLYFWRRQRQHGYEEIPATLNV